jgi:probable H4MPT-linked C1 transfer pathway protein
MACEVTGYHVFVGARTLISYAVAMPSPTVLGLDIGGANLKAAHTDGSACNQPFELWKNSRGLGHVLKQLLQQLPKSDILAATMTGELCDCFATKREGVANILDAVAQAAPNVPTRIWTTRGKFVDLRKAMDRHMETASANWLALATYVGRYVSSGCALLIDIGSTTTDIVPLVDARPAPQGRTDPERLRCRELVYTGVRRTPICTLLGAEGAAEHFATTLDVYLLLDEIAENPEDFSTADGRPATREAAHARMARMACADTESFSEQEAMDLAQTVFNRQMTLLRDAVAQVSAGLSSQVEAVVISGVGESLARKVIDKVKTISLTEILGRHISQSACAYAVAVLAKEAVVNQS